MSQTLRGADIVARSLQRLGCRRIYTLSGNHIMSIFDTALVTGGPGHANAVGALFTALGAESPMVLLSGHAATWEIGRGGFQELRQAEMAAPVTKASFTSTSAANIGRDIGE